jgi:hypothetical protein
LDESNGAGVHPHGPGRRLALALGSVRHRLGRVALSDWAIIALTGVIAYSTWSSDRTFQRQLDQMRVASRQTDRAIDVSIDEGANAFYQSAITAQALKLAQDNAKVGRGQLVTAQDTEQRQLRAYIFATPLDVLNFAPEKTPFWGVQINAIGSTPAYDVKAVTGLAALPFPNPDISAAFAKTLNGVPVTKNIMFPGTPEIEHNALGFSLSPEQFTALQQSKAYRIYAFGRVTYRDGFGKSHFTEFCFSYNGAGDHPGVEVCPEFNRTDEDARPSSAVALP